MKIGIIGKTDRKKVFDVTRELCEWLKLRNIPVYVEQELGTAIGHRNSISSTELPDQVDIILVLGGDGTFLSVARLVCRYEIPILGVNLGGLGFLTEITTSELYPMMERILTGDYAIEKRDMLTASIHRESETTGHYTVLNDVVINKGAVARMVDLAIYINGSHVTNFRSDGIILATPTGSTAYSLSAGGPILYPTLPVTAITPICSHTLTNRPIVIPNDTMIKIKILSDTPDVYLTLDGQVGVTLKMGDIIEVIKADTSVKLIRSPFRDYFTILKNKLMWGERYGYATVEE